MKIVVLDGYALNPGDLSWDGLNALGDCVVYERTPVEQIVERAAGAWAVLTNKTVLSATTLAALPDLRYIGVLATGYNVVDVEAAARQGIAVTNVPAYGAASVAQLVFALLLEMCSQVGHHARLVREGAWTRSPDFAFWDRPLIELEGLTLGIVGFGDIGRKVAALGRAFGMEILVHTKHPEKYRGQGADVAFAELDDLFARSDVVSLHCPLTAETERLVDTRRLALMKSTARLINTGRGALVDEATLAAALNDDRLAGAGLDVLCQEPPPADNPLLQARNCFITPHVAWATGAARGRLLAGAVGNLRDFLAGVPRNVVNGVGPAAPPVP
ncbi:D-2-hydroxyacid dehydrogenase [Trichloromonas acetexigens]|uniref:D-2-hydroxyacid dehydrogenase n=1 Tax=Trichloromonas acetexigens TaxID=38815 RepID=A0A550J620_9BACT|nr:D-2-hydroxyacid dehydrogenase [Desulfuromonas acetexigens]TRO78700.1 D-2-hydroxyacid dehydrogenase [Desulfuromonas acetexigens]